MQSEDQKQEPTILEPQSTFFLPTRFEINLVEINPNYNLPIWMNL